MNWEKVCQLDDIPENAGACVLVKDKQIAIFRYKEKLYALDNMDPFSKANVLSRGIVGDLNGSTVIASPVYKQHFKLEDGLCIEDNSVKLSTYDVRLTGGDIEIEID